jgi:hypothetical protein
VPTFLTWPCSWAAVMEASPVWAVLERGTPGQAMLGRIGTDATGFVTAFHIREVLDRLAHLPAEPRIEARAEAAWQEEVLVAFALAQVEGIDRTYETWLNPASGLHRSLLEDLARQSTLQVHFYVDSGQPVRVVELPTNPLAAFATQTLQRAAGVAPWTRQRFDAARQAVESRYPTSASLWQSTHGFIRGASSTPVEIQAKVSAYDNAGVSGSGLCGKATFRVDDRVCTMMAHRIPTGSRVLMVGGAMLLALMFAALIIGVTLLVGPAGESFSGPVPQWIYLLAGGWIALVILALAGIFAGRTLANRGPLGTVSFLLGDIPLRMRKVRRDWYVGWLLMLFTSVPVGLLITILRGRRRVRIKVPVGPRGQNRYLRFKTANKKDGAVLNVTLRS